MYLAKLLTSDDESLIQGCFNISASVSPFGNNIGHERGELRKVFTVEHDGKEMFKMLRTAVQWTADSSSSSSRLNVNGLRCSSAS